MKDELKKAALKRMTAQVTALNDLLKKYAPKWEPNNLPDYVIRERNQALRDEQYAELKSVSGKDDAEIEEALVAVFQQWMVSGEVAQGQVMLRDAAVRHLVKLAKRGEWVDAR